MRKNIVLCSFWPIEVMLCLLGQFVDLCEADIFSLKTFLNGLSTRNCRLCRSRITLRITQKLVLIEEKKMVSMRQATTLNAHQTEIVSNGKAEIKDIPIQHILLTDY